MEKILVAWNINWGKTKETVQAESALCFVFCVF